MRPSRRRNTPAFAAACTRRARHAFSLMELVVVVAILGVLALLLLPGFGDTTEDARRQAALSEMRTIQTAFRRLCNDCQLTPDDLALLGRYGLWPLQQNTWPTAFAGAGSQPTDSEMTALVGRLAKWDEERLRGWRGPYTGFEAAAPVETATARPGQLSATDLAKSGATATDRITLPVFTDPWSDRYSHGNGTTGLTYYRVLLPPTGGTGDGPARHLALVCTGGNGLLDTSPSDYDTNSAQFTAQGDDLVLRLLPLEN